MYDKKPHDVGDWYRTVRLKSRAEDGGGVELRDGSTPANGRHTPVSPALSSVTLSPDGNKSAHWLDGYGSEADSVFNGAGDLRRGSGGSVTQQQQQQMQPQSREASISRRSPAPSSQQPKRQQQTVINNRKASQFLPPSGANSPAIFDSRSGSAGGRVSSPGKLPVSPFL